MRPEIRGWLLVAFVVLLGGATSLVALRDRPAVEQETNRTAAGRATQAMAAAPSQNAAPRAFGGKSEESEAESIWKKLFERRGSHRYHSFPFSPKRPEEVVLQESSVQFADTSLRDALTFLQDQHGVKIWIDEADLREQKVPLDKPVSLTVDGVRLDWVLDRLLLPLKLDWLIDRDLLRVTTQAAAERHLEVRAYDVLDLIEAGFDEDTLLDIVEGCVHPESWGGPDGPGTGKQAAGSAEKGTAKRRGRTRLSNGVMIVWQTQRVHAGIEQLLDDIETILDDADEERRIDPHVVTVKHRLRIKRKGKHE